MNKEILAALEVLEDMRKRVLSGEIIALAAVGLTKKDEPLAWITTTDNVSRVRTFGAIHWLATAFMSVEPPNPIPVDPPSEEPQQLELFGTGDGG